MLDQRLITIENEQDPRIADYQATRNEKLLAARNLFIVEGKVVLRVMASTGRRPLRSVFVARSKLPSAGEVLATVPATVPIYVAPHQLLNRVARYPVHRGILSAGDRGEALTASDLLGSLGPGRRIVLLLEGLSSYEQIGSVFRNAAAFGAAGVILDSQCADPLHRKSLRVASGGGLLVPFARCQKQPSPPDMLEQVGLTTLELTTETGAPSIRQLGRTRDLPQRIALVLPPETTARTKHTKAGRLRARLDLAPGFESLSVATTSGIALYELNTWPATDPVHNLASHTHRLSTV